MRALFIDVHTAIRQLIELNRKHDSITLLIPSVGVREVAAGMGAPLSITVKQGDDEIIVCNETTGRVFSCLVNEEKLLQGKYEFIEKFLRTLQNSCVRKQQAISRDQACVLLRLMGFSATEGEAEKDSEESESDCMGLA